MITTTAPGTRRSRRWLAGAAAALTAMAVTLLGPVPAASAHTTLKSSDPAADSTLDSPPTSVELVFAQQVGSPDPKVAITIAGHEPVEIPATIDGSTVSADLTGVDIPGLTDATYPVQWTLGYRLIALDGDPFSGLLNFTVTAPPTAADTTPTTTDVTEPTAAPTTTSVTQTATSTPPTGTTPSSTPPLTSSSASSIPAAGDSGSSSATSPQDGGVTTTPSLSAAADDGSGNSPAGWIIGGVIVVVLAAVAVAVVLRRRPTTRS